MRRYLGAIILGLAGCVILVGLGIWQLQRLAWKETVLAEIEERIDSTSILLPMSPDPAAHRFLPVQTKGAFDGTDVPVFLSHDSGPIYRLVAAFETSDGRRILVDRGSIPGLTDPDPDLRTAPSTEVTVTGNLHWPDEVDGWTPPPDARGVHFGRDVDVLAGVLRTEPVLIIARRTDPKMPGATPLPVTTAGIPNNHLGYAVQWFGLALVWAGMTLFLLWRIRNQRV